jgi:UDP-N-acetylmuramate--alanine ligase
MSTSLTQNPLQHAKNVYFIGIGGIGMSALVRYFLHKGVNVFGYDKTPSELTSALEKEGAVISFQDEVEALPVLDLDIVVYTPAIPSTSNLLQHFKAQHPYLVKRSDVLQWITQTYKAICIAGTHGKTTVSSMVAHVLHHSGFGCTAFLGGIVSNYQTNFIAGTNDWCVIEADEYDRSFLKLSPTISVVNSVDADHLDIYKTAEAVVEAFGLFVNKTTANGAVYLQQKVVPFVQTSIPVKSFSCQDATADVYAKDIRIENGCYIFTAVCGNIVVPNIYLQMGGLHNVENALVAVAIAVQLGISTQAIQDAVASFQGVKRRFQYHLNTHQQVLIDDYAHHPTELQALITGVKAMFPNDTISLVFQPHLFSRTSDLVNEFAEVLAAVDQLFLLPIYPARELPVPGVTSEWLASKIKGEKVTVLSTDTWVDEVVQHTSRVLVLAGAGDIDTYIPSLVNKLG